MSRSVTRGTHRSPVESRYVHKTADQSNSTLVAADVTGLAWEIEPLGVYVVEFGLFKVAAATTTGLGLALAGPASPTYFRLGWQAATAFTTIQHIAFSALGSANACVATPSVTVAYMDTLNGYLVNGVNGGTLKLQMQTEIDTSAVTIQRGSWGRLTRVG